MLKNRIAFPHSLLTLFTLLLAGCATTYSVTPYPRDAEISVKNPVTNEVFALGTGPVQFHPKQEYGEGFFLTAQRKGFQPRQIFVVKSQGATSDYVVTLRPEERPKESKPAENSRRAPASVSDTNASQAPAKSPNQDLDLYREQLNAEIRKKVDSLLGEEQERVRRAETEAAEKIRRADEERRELMAEKLRLEFEKKTIESAKKVAILEKTFDVYKDALFSERYSRGPASFDRRRIDTTVELVDHIQRDIDEKKLEDAGKLVDQLLEKDEYFAKGYALKGTVKYLQNQHPQAIQAWERALELNPGDEVTRHYLAEAYQKQGRVPAQESKPLVLKIREQ